MNSRGHVTEGTVPAAARRVVWSTERADWALGRVRVNMAKTVRIGLISPGSVSETCAPRMRHHFLYLEDLSSKIVAGRLPVTDESGRAGRLVRSGAS